MISMAERSPVCMHWMRMMVSIYAIGSLLPLSSSSMGRKLFFRLMRCVRSVLNTEAESVDDMVAASSSELIRLKPISVCCHPDIQ